MNASTLFNEWLNGARWVYAALLHATEGSISALCQRLTISLDLLKHMACFSWNVSFFHCSLDVNLRLLAYRYGMQNSNNEQAWNYMFEKYQNTALAQEKEKLLYGLASVKNITLLDRSVQNKPMPFLGNNTLCLCPSFSKRLAQSFHIIALLSTDCVVLAAFFGSFSGVPWLDYE